MKVQVEVWWCAVLPARPSSGQVVAVMCRQRARVARWCAACSGGVCGACVRAV